MRLLVVLATLFLTGCGHYISVGVSAESEARRYPLVRAAIDCDLEDLKRLTPAHLNETDSIGRTALSWAMMRQCTDGALLLIEAGAAVHRRDKGHWSPVQQAAIAGNARLLKALFDRGADPNDADANGANPLHHAAASGNKESVELLISRGALVNAANDKGATPLHYGAADADVVDALIRAGANVNARATDDSTPISWAPRYPPKTGIEGMRALIRVGADFRSADEHGSTAFTVAAVRSDVQCAQELLALGADVNRRGKTGKTVLSLIREVNSRDWTWSNIAFSLIDPGYKASFQRAREMEAFLVKNGATI